MPLELSILLILAAGVGGFFLGRKFRTTGTGFASVICYDCGTNMARVEHLDVDFLMAYGWDAAAGNGPSDVPPDDAIIIEPGTSPMDIAGIPHENNATSIILQIWGGSPLYDKSIDCNNNSIPCTREINPSKLP